MSVYIYRERKRERERDTAIHESIVTARLDDKQSFLEREREREREEISGKRDNWRKWLEREWEIHGTGRWESEWGDRDEERGSEMK